MGDTTTELQLGAQTKAAHTVELAVPDLGKALKTSAEGIQAEAAGFSGAAAGAFYTALKAWFQAGAQIPNGVSRYGASLAATDANVTANQTSTAQAYNTARTRLSREPQ